MAGKNKCVPTSLSSWGSCQTAWKGSLKAAQDDWALKGCGGWPRVTCITRGKYSHPEPRAGWREKQHPDLGGKKGARHSGHWVREASLGSLMFCLGRHRDSMWATALSPVQKWGRDEKKSQKLMLQHSRIHSTSWLHECCSIKKRVREAGSYRVDTEGHPTVFRVLSEERKRVGRPDASKCFHRYLANMSLL